MIERFCYLMVSNLPQPVIETIQRVRQGSPFLNRLAYQALAGLKRGEGVTTVKRGPGKGIQLYRDGAALQYVLGTCEPLVPIVLERIIQKGDVVYDIGANIGIMSLLAARVAGPSGRVYAFEPFPASCMRLRRNAELNGVSNIELFEAAVGEERGHARFLVATDSTLNKLESTGAQEYTSDSIEVEILTVDGLLEEGRIPPPRCVKVDVEGAEGMVLRGMARTLAEHRPLILLQCHSTNVEIEQLLTQMGYWQVVIDSPDLPLSDAVWNASVVAGPAGTESLREELAALVTATDS